MLLALMAVAGGCGEERGAAQGATVSIYAAAPLCAEARRESVRSDNRAGELRVRVVCLPGTEGDERLDLATVGKNARRASEDSSSVAYISLPGRSARFSAPILESAGIPQLEADSGTRPMTAILTALHQADASTNPRQSVFKELR